MEGINQNKNQNQNNNNGNMEIDDGSASGSAKKPERISEYELGWRDYRMRVRATDALWKRRAEWNRQRRLKWMNMNKKGLIEEELFFSFDIDLNRLKVSDTGLPAPTPTTSQWDLVSDKQTMQPAPPGGATSPGSDSGSAKKPERISEYELGWRDYRMRVRATDALWKRKAEWNRQRRLKWMNMNKKRLIEEELFFSFDIDLNRLKVSDTGLPAPTPTTSQWDLVSDKQMMQPAPLGGATAPVAVPSFPNKD